MRCCTICLCIISRIYLLSGGFFEEDGSTSQMESYFRILFFSILLCHIGLLCLFACLYFVFIIIFLTEVFEGPSGGDSPQLSCFIFVLALKIHCVCSVLKRRGDYMKTPYPRCFGVENTWSVCKDLATQLQINSPLMSFEKFDSFTQ